MDNLTTVDETTHLEFGHLSTAIWEPEYFSELLCDACESSTIDEIELLLGEWLESTGRDQTDNESFRATPSNFSKAIEVAITAGRLDVAACLLEKGGGFQITEQVVRAAVKTGSTESLELLLNHGWDVNMPESLPAIRAAVKLDSIPLVKWFLDHGCSVNLQPQTMFGLTPLSTAICRASLEMIQFLHSHGADLSQDDVVLHTLDKKGGDRKAVLRYLLEHGAPVNEWKFARCASDENYDIKTHYNLQAPLHRAVRLEEWGLVRILVEFGAEWDMKDSWGVTARGIMGSKGKEHWIKNIMKEIEREKAAVVKPYCAVKSLL